MLILGPTNWVPRYRPKIPGWVTSILPPGRIAEGTDVPTARDVRCGLVARLRLADVKSTMMELHQDYAGEDPEAKLTRVIREDKMDQYAMFWPWGGVRAGLDVEIGWLLKSIRVGEVDPDNIAVFYECSSEGKRAAELVERKDGTTSVLGKFFESNNLLPEIGPREHHQDGQGRAAGIAADGVGCPTGRKPQCKSNRNTMSDAQ